MKTRVMITNSEEPWLPGHKLKPQKLQCPFCSTISTRGTGLSAHVRGQHAKEYRKWNSNPNRLSEAAAASAQQEPKTNRRLHAVRSPELTEVRKAAVPAQARQEQPSESAAPASQTGKTFSMMKAFSCPVMGCGKISPRPQGLAAHVRNAHPEHWKKFGTKPATVSETPTQSVQTTNAAPNSPLEHLELAITVLRNKQEAGRAEIQRLTGLQAEEADITRQLEALTQARAAFAPGQATTAGDTGATVQVDAPDQATKTFQHQNAIASSDLHDVDVASMPVKQRRGPSKKGAAANAPVETTQVEPVPPRSRLSDEGRKRIVEATKKFWAAKRQAK